MNNILRTLSLLYIEQSKRAFLTLYEFMQEFPLTYGFLKTGLPLIIVEVFNHKLCFLLDTGSNKNIIDKRIYNHFIDKLPVQTNTGSLLSLGGKSGESIEIEIPFKFEQISYCEPFLCTGEISSFDEIKMDSGVQIHGILGSQFFLKHDWIIDFEKRMVYTTKNNENEDTARD